MIKSCIVTLVGLFSFSTPVMAWYCNDVASERQGDIINSCGVAEEKNEALARKVALENAIHEFKSICNISADCKGHKTLGRPMRNACDQTPKGYKCYRGIEFKVLDEKDDGSDSNPETQKLANYSNTMAALDLEIKQKEEELQKLKAIEEKKQQLKSIDTAIEKKEYTTPVQKTAAVVPPPSPSADDDPNAPIVETIVSSEGGKSIQKGMTINFVSKSDTDLVDRCAKGAQKYGWKTSINAKDCRNCAFVTLEYDSSIPENIQGIVGNVINSVSGRTTGRTTTRILILRLYKDSGLSESLREINLKSTGDKPIRDVTPQMCNAAFADFPGNLDQETYKSKLY